MPQHLTYNVIVAQDGVSRTYLKGQELPSAGGQAGCLSGTPSGRTTPSEPPSLPSGSVTEAVVHEAAEVQIGVSKPRTLSELRALRRFRQDELASSLGINPSEFATRAALCEAIAAKLSL